MYHLIVSFLGIETFCDLLYSFLIRIYDCLKFFLSSSVRERYFSRAMVNNTLIHFQRVGDK